MNRNKIVLTLLILAMVLSMPACSKNKTQKYEDSQEDTDLNKSEINKINTNSLKYGVITTSMYEELGTTLKFFDENLKEKDSCNYDYGNVGDYGYGVPIVKNGILYEFSLGYGYDKEYGTVLGIDLSSKDVKEYHFNRTNITETVVTDDYVYVISNINQATYIDRYSFQTSKVDSITLDHFIGLDFCVDGNDVYTFNEQMDSYWMYRVNIDDQTCEKVYDLTSQCLEDEIRYLEIYKNHIYMLCDDELIQYSISDQIIQEIGLSRNDAWGMYLYRNELYLSCLDYYNDAGEADLLVYDLDKQEFTIDYHIPTSIMQFEVVDDESIVVLDRDDTISRYHLLEDGNVKLDCSATIGVTKGVHTSGLIVE